MPGHYRHFAASAALSAAAGLLGCSTTTQGYDPVIIAALYAYVDVFNTHDLAALRAASCPESAVQSAIIARPLITLAVESVANTTRTDRSTAHITFTERHTITPRPTESTTVHVSQTWRFTKTIDGEWKYCQPPTSFWERAD